MRRMKLTLAILITASVLILVATLFAHQVMTPPTSAAVRHAQDQAQIHQIEQDDHRATVFGWAWPSLLLVLALGAVFLLLRNGGYVMRRSGDAMVAKASRQPVPESLTYSPSITVRHHVTGAPARAPLPAQPVALPAPSLGSLLGTRRLAFGTDYHTGEAVALEGEWPSVGIAGRPHSGKTATMAMLCAQVAYQGGLVRLGDPHEGARRSLATYLAPLARVMEVASTPEEILQLVRAAHAELQVRKQVLRSGRLDQSSMRPIAVAIDEWTGLIRSSVGDELARLLADIVSEGQKYGVIAFLAAQGWSTVEVGGGLVRDPLNAAIIHRTRPDEIRMLAGLRGGSVPEDVIELEPGVAYLVSPDGRSKVRIPRVGEEDLREAGAAFPQPSRALPPTFQLPSAGPSSPSPSEFGSASEGLGRHEEEQVLQLWQSGWSSRQILRQHFGITGGRHYNTRLAEIEEVIRRAGGSMHG